jgi:predicted nucleotide-binding protein (sugar kinase/HSP70/actin superfamily)
MKETAKIIVGIPRAMLYYRYGGLWHDFFTALDISTILSQPTHQATLDEGARIAADESCLSHKVFLGHVQELIGQCDYILIPRISSFGRRREMCVRFSALYDQTRTIFRDTGQKFLTYNLDALSGMDEAAAFQHMGHSLGCSPSAVGMAYARAKKAEKRDWQERVKAEETLYEREGVKILIAAHSYILEDPYLGAPILDILKALGTIPVRAYYTDREAALKKSDDISPTCKWEMSRELMGSISLHEAKADGVILLSAFPCGPDAMVNELLIRKFQGKPVLNLVLDGQSGTAGLETRLESFVDILRFKEG